jgi:hypothetical protein
VVDHSGELTCTGSDSVLSEVCERLSSAEAETERAPVHPTRRPIGEGGQQLRSRQSVLELHSHLLGVDQPEPGADALVDPEAARDPLAITIAILNQEACLAYE